MKVRFALVFLSLMSFGGAANAADIPAPAPATAPVYVPPRAAVYNWTGFYVGAMGGYGWSNSQGNDLKGGFAGGTIGGNAQFGNFVVGVEGEGAWADIEQSASGFFGLVTATDRIQAFGSLTGRLGVALDNVLIYGKGGGALASNKLSVSGLGLVASDTQTHLGYTVGGGVEWGITPNWSVKGEYLWAHYESKNYFASLVPPGIPSGTLEVNTVKFGVNYRFGWNDPVTARY
ncbi:MAG TPA: outer membrane protein [Bradyrhizobium sp.]|jgi:outer membrane immunogenic protein